MRARTSSRAAWTEENRPLAERPPFQAAPAAHSGDVPGAASGCQTASQEALQESRCDPMTFSLPIGRHPLDDEFVWSLVREQWPRLALAGAAVVACVACNLASPVLAGAMFQNLIQRQPFPQCVGLDGVLCACVCWGGGGGGRGLVFDGCRVERKGPPVGQGSEVGAQCPGTTLRFP